MKTKANIKLITVGRLVKELSKFEKKCADYDVACWAPDYLTCCVTGHRLDEDGDLCIHLEQREEDGGYCTVEMLLADLASYDRDVRVYMKSCGYYLNFETDDGIFTENDDDEIVGCHANAFGEYDYYEEKNTYEKGFLQEYMVLDNGDKGTTDAQFIMNTIRELCFKANLSEDETRMYEKAVWRTIEKYDVCNIGTFMEGNWK